MKNVIVIDIDTDREMPIIIGKPDSITPPTTTEEAKEMINHDIVCLREALLTLIHTAAENGYGDIDVLVEQTKASIKSDK